MIRSVFEQCIEENATQIHGSNSMPSLICPRCKYQTERDESFCCKCGAELIYQKAFCKFCGTELKPDNQFCTQCGTNRENNKTGKTIFSYIKSLVWYLLLLMIPFSIGHQIGHKYKQLVLREEVKKEPIPGFYNQSGHKHKVIPVFPKTNGPKSEKNTSD